MALESAAVVTWFMVSPLVLTMSCCKELVGKVNSGAFAFNASFRCPIAGSGACGGFNNIRHHVL